MRSQCLVIVVTLCFTLISLPLADAATPDETVLQAGAAISNITPPISLDPVTQSKRPPATHVHDELHARCLVLDDGQVRLALVVCDLRHMSAEVAANAKQLIQTATGIPP